MKTKVFKDFEEYENWTEQFENCFEYERIPTAVDDGWRVSADLIIECKRWKTALRRFAKAFSEVNEEIAGWCECIRESCENGYFEDTNGWRPAHTDDPKEIAAFAKKGKYSYGVEELDEGLWYVFLNISGIYAGREAL